MWLVHPLTFPSPSLYETKQQIKMSVVGVDFGSLNTVIAVARNRGVDVVCFGGTLDMILCSPY